MTLRLSSDQEVKLAALAERMHVSRTALIKQAIDEKLERDLHRQQVREAAEFFEQRDEAVLKRLAEYLQSAQT